MSCSPTCLKQSSCYNCDKTIPFKELPYEQHTMPKGLAQLWPLNYVNPMDLRKPSTI